MPTAHLRGLMSGAADSRLLDYWARPVCDVAIRIFGRSERIPWLSPPCPIYFIKNVMFRFFRQLHAVGTGRGAGGTIYGHPIWSPRNATSPVGLVRLSSDKRRRRRAISRGEVFSRASDQIAPPRRSGSTRWLVPLCEPIGKRAALQTCWRQGIDQHGPPGSSVVCHPKWEQLEAVATASPSSSRVLVQGSRGCTKAQLFTPRAECRHARKRQFLGAVAADEMVG